MLLKKSKQQIPRGLKPARNGKIKSLTAHLKVRPFKKSAESDFFSNLFSLADGTAQKNRSREGVGEQLSSLRDSDPISTFSA